MPASCHYCGTRIYQRGSPEVIANPQVLATKDHVVPQLFATEEDRRVKSRVNTVMACAMCNNIKNDAPAEVFRFFLASTRGTKRFSNLSFRRLLYALAIVGFRTVFADAAARKPPPEASPAVGGTSRYTLRDLRR